MGLIEFYAIFALMCLSFLVFLKTRLKRWLLLALGCFLLTSNIISVGVLGLLSVFVFPPYKFVDLALNVELVTSVTMMAIALGLILKETWNKYRVKPKQTTTTYP